MKYFLLLFFICYNSFSQNVKVVVEFSDNLMIVKQLTINGVEIKSYSSSKNQLNFQTSEGQKNIAILHNKESSCNFSVYLSSDTTLFCNSAVKTLNLEEITIKEKSNIDIKNNNLGSHRISVKEMAKIPVLMGEIDIQRGLQTLPGVNSVGEGANGLNIRGGSTDQNLLIVDGMPIYNPTHIFGLLSVIPSEIINTIELFKSNLPVRYGGRIASVIQINTLEPALNQIQIKGGIGILASKFAINTPIFKDRLAISLAARNSSSSFLLKNFRDLERFKGGFNEVYTKLLYKINPNQKLTGNYMWTEDNVLFKGIPLFSEGNNSSDSDVGFGINNASIKWSHNSKNNKIFTDITLVNAIFKNKLESPDNKLTLAVSNKIINQKATINQIFKINTYAQLEYGIESQKNKIEPGRLSENGKTTFILDTENSLESAAYVSYSHSNNKLKYDIGLRYSVFTNNSSKQNRKYLNPNFPKKDELLETNNDVNGSNRISFGGFEPRFSLTYLLNNSSSIKSSYSLTRQYIQIITNNTTPLPTSRWKTSDAFLKPQVSNQFSVGYFKLFEDSKTDYSIELYSKTIANITEVKMGSNFLLENLIETEILQGRNKSYGMEMMVSKSFENVILNFNYTFNRSFNKVVGKDFFTQVNNGEWYRAVADRPHTVNMNLKIQQSPIHHFSFAMIVSSGRPYTAPVGVAAIEQKQFPIFLYRNNFRTPLYHRMDVSWNIDNPARKKRFKGSWAINIYNLYARKNVYSIFFSNKTGAVQAYKLSVFPNPIPSISYNFSFQ